jgi:hypothetical protein
MKAILSAILLSVVLAATSVAAESKVFRDDLLHKQYDSFENFSLAQIFLALPQELFDGTYQQRIESLIRGRVQFRPDKHEIFYPGDGGQMTLQIQVVSQTKDKLILHVNGESEGKMFWRLERIPNGWKAEEKHIE